MEKKLYVVGIGPGAGDKMTIEARAILEEVQVIAGYTAYVDLVKNDFPDKEYIVNGMMREEERCRQAYEAAGNGKAVAMICSGDSGVYGMAGLILMMQEEYPEVEVSVVPGITAALSGGAVLGAPLGHDFAIISLSDLLTPWEKIEKRLECAAMGDMGIVLYNPSSQKRADYLQRACDIILKHQSESIVCGYVQNIGREGENYHILSLGELRDTKVDMFTTVFVGNSESKVIGGKMVTPRIPNRHRGEK